MDGRSISMPERTRLESGGKRIVHHGPELSGEIILEHTGV